MIPASFSVSIESPPLRRCSLSSHDPFFSFFLSVGNTLVFGYSPHPSQAVNFPFSFVRAVLKNLFSVYLAPNGSYSLSCPSPSSPSFSKSLLPFRVKPIPLLIIPFFSALSAFASLTSSHRLLPSDPFHCVCRFILLDPQFCALRAFPPSLFSHHPASLMIRTLVSLRHFDIFPALPPPSQRFSSLYLLIFGVMTYPLPPTTTT